MNQQYQGDVSIIKIEKTDSRVSFLPLPKEGFVVAEGEVTGHKHTIVADRESSIEIAKDENGYFLKINAGKAIITHQQHAPITIEQGLYFVGRQWEYDEIQERRVQD